MIIITTTVSTLQKFLFLNCASQLHIRCALASELSPFATGIFTRFYLCQTSLSSSICNNLSIIRLGI
jgi:hypothetical protein